MIFFHCMSTYMFYFPIDQSSCVSSYTEPIDLIMNRDRVSVGYLLQLVLAARGRLRGRAGGLLRAGAGACARMPC